jgi:hypothetical protein
MHRFFQVLLILAVIGGGLAVAPKHSQADDYWNGYWGWYDNHYRPYYHRHYSYYPRAYQQYYSPPYYSQPYYGYRDYYGSYPSYGYRDYGSGGSIQIGPYSFGWR